jgi:cGMP-dependent protein kinase
MAPEIVLGKGYSYTADLWSVGVCMYEFFCGGVPYAEDVDVLFFFFSNIRTLMKFTKK